MIPDSDKRFGPLQAKDGDDRMTRVGKVLRASALDELPQLWKIFKGDMRFVGPRALLPEEIEVNGNGDLIPLGIIPGYEKRHRVRPGLTGLPGSMCQGIFAAGINSRTTSSVSRNESLGWTSS